MESLTNLVRMLEAYATSEPTFARDASVTTVDEFSYQIDSDALPRQAATVPDTASVIGQGRPRAERSRKR
jgi:hypothetical protein